MREEVTPTTHFFQLECVHDFPLRSFVNVFFGQINDLLGVHAASHFQSPHFAEIVFVFIGNDVAAGEAFNRDNHCVAMRRVVGVYGLILIIILHRYF